MTAISIISALFRWRFDYVELFVMTFDVPSTSAGASGAAAPTGYAVEERECMFNQCKECTYTSFVIVLSAVR